MSSQRTKLLFLLWIKYFQPNPTGAKKHLAFIALPTSSATIKRDDGAEPPAI